MIGERFKSKHPAVPAEWEQLGEGGNAYVWNDGVHAIKRLKPNAPAEAIARFRREADILSSLQDSTEVRVTAVREIRDRAGGVEIVMDKLDGNLDKVIHRFASQPEKAARALAPIADTLATLADRQRPIHHRDIKPSNLLFKQSEDELYLADFGCAYLAEDERLTPPKRAMGAWAYRPPEYSVERVADVDEKGDVFSLGKVFWSMINGEAGVVFPGPVWFGKEYDLGSIYPESPKIHHAMLLIAKAAAVDPSKRPKLKQFADMLRALGETSPITSPNDASAEMLRAEALIEIEYEQRRAATATFVRAVHKDLLQAIAALRSANADLQMWREWEYESRRTPQKVEALVQQVAEHESDAPVVNVRSRRRSFTTRFYPATEKAPASFRASLRSEDDPDQVSTLDVTNDMSGLRYDVKYPGAVTMSGPYDSLTLKEFLETATRHALVG